MKLISHWCGAEYYIPLFYTSKLCVHNQINGEFCDIIVAVIGPFTHHTVTESSSNNTGYDVTSHDRKVSLGFPPENQVINML